MDCVCDWSFNFDAAYFAGCDVTYVRKLMEGISHVGAGACLFLLGGMGVSLYRFSYCLILMFLAFFCHGFEVIGSGLNPTDLTSRYSGLVYGLMNTFSALPGLYLHVHVHL